MENINMSHTWKHPAHYHQLSEKRKKIHEAWIQDQEEKPQASSPEASSSKQPAASSKLKKNSGATN